jgi:hypothetical protein
MAVSALRVFLLQRGNLLFDARGALGRGRVSGHGFLRAGDGFALRKQIQRHALRRA